jgi:putative restriction endonuclease
MRVREKCGALSVKGVFEISGNSRYDDLITERYHFPSQYLSEARQLENDWILYRETRVSGGRMAYIATAFVERIDPDEADPTHYYARIRDYLPFDDAVSYRDKDGRFAERFLRDMARPGDAGRTLRGKSVRTLDDDDFVAIVNQGLSETLDPESRIRLELDERHIDDVTAALLADDFGERRIEQILVNKKIRAAAFRNQVLDAYDSTCAVTGLRIINGGGKAEAQAAHIWSVADGGPDIVPNGVALSATAHWLFDRHLITFDDNLCLLVSHNKVPSNLLKLFPPSGQKIRLPVDPRDHPRRDFLAKHRARFAGS